MDGRTTRERMVRLQLAGRGIEEGPVLEAMAAVPREAFVPQEMVEFAYEDAPLPIGEGQTISQPYIVAVMARALELGPEDRVLDVGTGSGYAAAVLAHIAADVYTVERHRALAESAERRFRALGFDNVHVHVGDGSLGWEDHAPYDAIQVAAAGPDVPPELLEQLAPGGRLVIPTGPEPRLQNLLRLRRGAHGIERENLGPVRFVPLIGVAGWASDEESGEGIPRRGSGMARGERSPRRDPGKASEEGSPPRSSGGESGERRPRRNSRDERHRRTESSSEPPGTGTDESASGADGSPSRSPFPSLPDRMRRAAETFGSIEAAPLDGLLGRIGDARVVLLGEATHGTSEFYRMRAAITRALVDRKGFGIIAAEADWPDAAHLDAYVRDLPVPESSRAPFTRFPTWMWMNEEVADLLSDLRARNEGKRPDERIGFYGLDLYSLFTSLEVVLAYLDEVDPEAAELARHRYGCLEPWTADPAAYGRAVLTGRYRACEDEAVRTLTQLLERRVGYEARDDGRRFFDAEQNARLVANAERYYRIMYTGGRASWNLRDQHMFDTLEALLAHHGPDAKAVVWAHNSHLGDASATEMGARGEHNLGQLCRQRFGSDVYAIGFGTHRGTVAAAHDWGGEMQVMEVRPSHPRSYERICHACEVDRFFLALRDAPDELRRDLTPERLERAIGVVYRPETELQSHYFHASLPRQFDEWIWFDQTSALTPIPAARDERATPETFPFGV